MHSVLDLSVPNIFEIKHEVKLSKTLSWMYLPLIIIPGGGIPLPPGGIPGGPMPGGGIPRPVKTEATGQENAFHIFSSRLAY